MCGKPCLHQQGPCLFIVFFRHIDIVEIAVDLALGTKIPDIKLGSAAADGGLTGKLRYGKLQARLFKKGLGSFPFLFFASFLIDEFLPNKQSNDTRLHSPYS